MNLLKSKPILNEAYDYECTCLAISFVGILEKNNLSTVKKSCTAIPYQLACKVNSFQGGPGQNDIIMTLVEAWYES